MGQSLSLGGETSIVWVTNMAAPYRRPIWSYIGERSRLTTLLLESDSNLARAGRRGSDWLSTSGVETSSYKLEKLPTIRFGHGERLFYVAMANIFAHTGRADAVLIGGWDSPAYWQAWLGARLRGARVVGFYESTLATQHHARGPVAAARNFFFRRLDAVVVPGPAAKQALIGMGVPASRIHVGFNAVDVEKFAALNVAGATDARSPRHRYVYVGQLIPRKNLANLLHAFQHARSDADTLTIVGAGDLDEELRRQAGQLGLLGVVEFAAPVPNDQLPRLLSMHDTLILPSVEEVWGLVVNEALAAGLHVVVTRNAGVAASVADMRGVYLVDTDPESIGEGLASSRAGWSGRISSPEIMHHTPERFAEVFLTALTGPAQNAGD